MKTYCLTFFFSVLLVCAYGQNRSDSTKFNNRLYKREIGLGVSGILSGGLGNALVLKIRDDRSKLVPVSYSRYWRFQANWYMNSYSAFEDRFEGEYYNYEHFSRPNSEIRLSLTAGRERNNFSGRFNFYYGWDTRLSLSRNNYLTALRYSYDNVNQGQFIEYYRRTFGVGLRGYGFFGVKYHLSDRISVSVESAVYLGYLLNRGQTSAKEIYGIETKGTKWTQHEVEYGLQYLRFATLNYHFRRN